ncbi:hypothetical protein LSTR_LSTR009920 [Laodelphax striatellus]|uniref:Oxysterol-binding protein n=1 Tax=Laodelphax striatellus TaxID=195883 RepID=A0A482WKW5_LAOST|nr:hypothetical protein LSTR_LSTR009920 [Laodelphax striatellus]
MVCHDVLRHSLISVRNSTSVHDLVNLKKFANDYKNITDELIFNIDKLMKLIGVYMVIIYEDLHRKQRIRDEIEKFLDRVSSQNVIIEDAAKLYCLTEINEPRHSHSTKDYVGSREMLIRNHNLGAASLNTIKETPVHHVKSWIVREDEKRERENQRSRALEAYNQYIIVFPVTTKTNGVAGTSKSSSRRQRRINIPDRPQNTVNMWSLMKNSIGKDLSKIPMPVNFSEPLSALQRLVECFEYSHILDRAADCGDALEQLAYVAAFYVSGYSTNSSRISKPFNPLLGETFEWDRTDDYGWRVIAEQVSHHPPISALHCVGKEWTCWEDFSVVTKFRGKYLTAEPKGTIQ